VATAETTSTLLTEAQLRERVERWAAIDHGSATDGERQVAELLADELRGLGLDAVIEEERAHGGYWFPVGIPTALAAVGGFLGRAAAAVIGLFAAAAVADDINCERYWFRRRFLSMRTTYNVAATVGPEDAERTLVFMAHHDAPHSGLVFHPELPRAPFRKHPEWLENANTTVPTMWGAVFGPLAVGLGALFDLPRVRKFGAFLSAGYAAAMADIALRGAVPGANDNLSGVAAQMSLAHALAADPPRNTRVILLFPGSEESFQEGMSAWLDRHQDELPKRTTAFVNHETVGSPMLVLLEGEGMLGITDYSPELKRRIREVGDDLGIFLYKNLRTRNASDSLIPVRRGYTTAVIASCDEFKAPSNYHWPTDVPENLRYDTIADCARLTHELTRRFD
jgi:peptidase M28-like protein